MAVIFISVRLVFLISLTSSAHVKTTPSFTAIWNVPTFMCENKFGIDFNISKYGIVQNKDDTFRGDRMTILYRKELGLYPWINSDGTFINGGLPQLSNLTSHLKKASVDIDRFIPDENFSGAGVIDWENWRPIYKRNSFNEHQKVYMDQSEALVRRVHPDWSDEQVRQQAQTDFESAARSLMLKTLELCRKKRPRGRWGFYGFPSCYNYKPGESSCSSSIIAENNRLDWMFKASSALFPSIYLDEGFGSHGDRYNRVHGELEETLRVRGLCSESNTTILPYTRYTYGDTGQFYDIGDLNNTIHQTFTTKLDGVIIWGSSKDLKTEYDCKDLKSYIRNTFGPYIKNFTKPRNASLILDVNSTDRGWFDWTSSWKRRISNLIKFVLNVKC